LTAGVPGELVAALQRARHVVALTGSGISAESGVPTFRDAQTGLWAKFSPEELATPEAFARDPAFVWSWYRWRRELVARAQPNPGHYALAEIASLVRRFTLVTQNVDGLHQRAGSRDVIEFHGNILRDRCSRGCSRSTESAESPREGDALPHCDCGALLRPDVVWFGETIPPAALAAASAATRDCDVFLSIGTSSLVFPAAGFAQEARHGGATLVEVNPAATPLSDSADFTLRAPAGVALPRLLAGLRA
jgi:NAD-dependent deacetylase